MPFDLPTLKTLPMSEPNMNVSDHPLLRYGHSHILGAHGTPILGEGELIGVSDGIIRKSDGGFLQALHCDRCAICNHSDALINTEVSHFRPKFPVVPLGVDPRCLGLQRANITG